ncbi:MAG: fibrobacter succinogenes major paralogous domain-containing protein [Chitinophagales bacterium]|nr:fibrobacter succinogenes major paralogous domain-containing protein [Chitinophagales bacterium]
MKKLMYFIVLFAIIACKKDLIPTNTNPPTTNPPNTENPTTDDKKVRIVRVEQTVSPNSFPFDTDQLMNVEYVYSNGILKRVVIKRGVSTYVYFNSSNENTHYDIDLSADPTYNSSINFSKIKLNVNNGKIESVVNDFAVSIAPGQVLNKNFKYIYNNSGALTQINSKGLISEKKSLEVRTGDYENNLLKNYTLKNYILDYNPIPTIGQDYKMQVSYQKADGVPKDLIRKVNQAILGLSPMGFEDYSFHMEYDLHPNPSDLVHIQKVAKYKYSFADWIISFGLTDAYSIPEQGNQLISSKHIKGQKVIEGKIVNNIFSQPQYASIDSISQYAYIHHAEEKMLEIAGLKIFYEWSDSVDTEDPPIDEFGTLTDTRDGQKYKTVKIGNQTWFAENLRYAGNIPNVTDATEWINLSTPAWCYYDNESANNDVYGKLYNWYAVSTSNICPNGWHIPTDGEWKTLSNYLGGESVAGGKMKSTTGWNSPNTDATNESGFSGLPGGYRTILYDGKFGDKGNMGQWWSSTDNPVLYFRGLRYDNRALINYFSNPNFGYSCRCVKD